MHFEELAKLGDATALSMLDRYASKAVAEQIERERLMDLVQFEGLDGTWHINKYQLDPVI